jgi:hypothetical protein
VSFPVLLWNKRTGNLFMRLFITKLIFKRSNFFAKSFDFLECFGYNKL